MTEFPDLKPDDRRLNVFDDNGHEISSSGERAQIKIAFTELKEHPRFDCPMDTQLLYGEVVEIHARKGEWILVKAERDGYVGWLEEKALNFETTETTHIVCVPRTFFYSEPNFKLPHKGMRSLGSGLTIVSEVENNGVAYAIAKSGRAIAAKHIRPVDHHENDPVSVAESLLRTPYLWGGASAFGIDCSGLVKLALFMTGKRVLRDSDMQAATIGSVLETDEEFSNVERGDLIFWRGHVGWCQGLNDDGVHMLIHANANSMDVTSEPLLEAVERIAYLYERPIGVRRP